MKTEEKKAEEQNIIQKFLELCVPSLEPDLYTVLADSIVPVLKETRGLISYDLVIVRDGKHWLTNHTGTLDRLLTDIECANYIWLADPKPKAGHLQAFGTLTALLTDQEGNVAISGSDEDRMLIQESLGVLKNAMSLKASASGMYGETPRVHMGVMSICEAQIPTNDHVWIEEFGEEGGEFLKSSICGVLKEYFDKNF